MTSFWSGKKVLVTGHTGFKGTWLSLWLYKQGAKVLGYSLPPPSSPSLFESCELENKITSRLGDVRDLLALQETVNTFQPEVIFHLAAQSLVRKSYHDPIETYSTNVMGTVHLLEAVRKSLSTRVVLNITSDKCYENKEWDWGYREVDMLGGHDPYSNSKACAELVTDAYVKSFFKVAESKPVAVSTVRAGNIIGGGDWAEDRLVPDCIRAIDKNQTIVLRNPNSVRPWQHVLEPLAGYLGLAEKMWHEPQKFSGAWNFGPNEDSFVSVRELVMKVTEAWGSGRFEVVPSPLHEAKLLKLDCTKVKTQLSWKPRWDLNKTVLSLVDWYKKYYKNENMFNLTMRQIEDYEKSI